MLEFLQQQQHHSPAVLNDYVYAKYENFRDKQITVHCQAQYIAQNQSK